jgi:hypothetical protein
MPVGGILLTLANIEAMASLLAPITMDPCALAQPYRYGALHDGTTLFHLQRFGVEQP